MSAAAKVCVICGQDCAGKPRVKDPQGRYSCKSCHEAAAKRPGAASARPAAAPVKAAVAAGTVKAVAAPKPAPEPEVEAGFEGFDNAAILEGIEASPGAASPSLEPCAGCGSPMSPGAMVCMSCGFNKASGKAGKIKVSKEGTGAGAVAGAAATVLWQANPLAWALGGIIGGGIGAAVWAGVSYQVNREFGIIAWGVGLATGFGVVAVARNYASEFSGVIAAVIAIVAVLGGKYAAASLVAEDLPQQIGTTVRADDNDAMVRLATDIAAEYEEKGHVLSWPGGGSNEEAFKREDFPRDIWDEASKKWRAMKPQEREDFKHQIEEDVKARIAAMGSEEVAGAVFESSFGLLDIVFIVFAVMSAFSLGAGYGVPGGDD